MINSSVPREEDTTIELQLGNHLPSVRVAQLEKNWLGPTSDGIEAMARIEFLTMGSNEKQVHFVPCVKGILSNAVHKLAFQNNQQQNQAEENAINESMQFSASSLVQQAGSKALAMTSLISVIEEEQQAGFFTSLSNSSVDFDPSFDTLKNKLTKSNLVSKEVQEQFLKNIPPWFFVQPTFCWKVRLHGDRGTGKTTVQRSLCRANTQIDQHRNFHADTMGLVTTNTMIPLRFVDSFKWLELEIVDVGDVSAFNNTFYNSYNPSDYHAHLVLFSMGHFQSFRNAKNKIKQLKKHTNNIVVVATKADAFQNFQVTDNDIAEMVKDFDLKSTVCLINSHAQFGSANSTYMIVEQLAEMLIA